MNIYNMQTFLSLNNNKICTRVRIINSRPMRAFVIHPERKKSTTRNWSVWFMSWRRAAVARCCYLRDFRENTSSGKDVSVRRAPDTPPIIAFVYNNVLLVHAIIIYIYIHQRSTPFVYPQMRFLNPAAAGTQSLLRGRRCRRRYSRMCMRVY